MGAFWQERDGMYRLPLTAIASRHAIGRPEPPRRHPQPGTGWGRQGPAGAHPPGRAGQRPGGRWRRRRGFTCTVVVPRSSRSSVRAPGCGFGGRVPDGTGPDRRKPGGLRNHRASRSRSPLRCRPAA
ncbi:hypothetical protein ADL03_15055 [Nocardia sp. NRRL S-836]|nr:hypothetical protein ADL03_15055 [Nocardia sp. NRRL S-836]